MSREVEPFRVFQHAGWSLPLYEYGKNAAAGSPEPVGPRPARAPGAGRLVIEHLSTTVVGADLKITTRVVGRGTAYVLAELFLKDPGVDRYYGPVARRQARAARDVTMQGVAHPDWDDPIAVEVALTLTTWLLTDGVGAAFCFSSPAGYDDPRVQLEGQLTLGGGGVELRAVVTLDGAGRVQRVLVRKEQGRANVRRSFPRPVTLGSTDTFAPLVEVLSPGPDGEEWTVGRALSTRLSGGRLHVVEAAAIPGDYLAGVLVQDFDGGLTRRYVPLHLGLGAV